MRASVPVTPDPDTAREWAREELQDPVYQQDQSLLDRAIEWFIDTIADLFSTSGGDGLAALPLLIILLVIAALVAAVILIVRPALAQRERRDATLLEDDARSAQEIRAAARAAADAGDWDDAVLERFRAVIRSLEESGELDARPGRTAYEAARDGGGALPSHAAALLAASRTFDQVCYGHRPATSADHDEMSALDDAIAGRRSVR